MIMLQTILEDSAEKEEQQEQPPRRNAAIIAMDLIRDHCQEFFLDTLGRPYAAVKINKHLEVLPLKSSRFKNWLCKIYFDSSSADSDSDLEEQGSGAEDRNDSCGNGNRNNSTILNTDNLTNILRILEAEATFGGNSPRDLQLRIAKYDNAIYYDLTNPLLSNTGTLVGWIFFLVALFLPKENIKC